jgi:hypothetical protein
MTGRESQVEFRRGSVDDVCDYCASDCATTEGASLREAGRKGGELGQRGGVQWRRAKNVSMSMSCKKDACWVSEAVWCLLDRVGARGARGVKRCKSQDHHALEATHVCHAAAKDLRMCISDAN